MATLSISLITDYLPSQISNVDIYISKNSNVNEHQFRIKTVFKDGLNLRDGVVLTKFGRLEQGQDYTCILRIFLKEAPYIKHTRVLAFIRHDDNDALMRIRADI